MNRSAILIRVIGLVGLVTILVLAVVSPVGAFPFLAQTTPEPSPRPTVTPAPALELFPSEGVAGDATDVTAVGIQWVVGQAVSLFWDDVGNGPMLGQGTADGEGRFQISFQTPTDPAFATVGAHTVIAVQNGSQATASFELIAPTPTNTPTVTDTPTPTHSPTPVTPSATPTTTNTPIPSATLRPVTPMVTISPIPPTATRRPVATRTNTPLPGPPTQTPTPSLTPVPTQTPGPGTPSATPQATPTPVEDLSETGGGWGMVFIFGFVLGGLLLVFRLLRVRGLAG
jgi:hypothetical protein